MQPLAVTHADEACARFQNLIDLQTGIDNTRVGMQHKSRNTCGRNCDKPHPHAVVDCSVNGIAARSAHTYDKKHIERICRVDAHEDAKHKPRLSNDVRPDIE